MRRVNGFAVCSRHSAATAAKAAGCAWDTTAETSNSKRVCCCGIIWVLHTAEVTCMADKDKKLGSVSARKSGVSSEDRKKALETALGQIEKQFGKGAVMKPWAMHSYARWAALWRTQ